MLKGMFLTNLILSLSGTIIFLLIMLIKPVTKKLFSPSWNYYFIIIAAIIFICPYGLIVPKAQKPSIDVKAYIEQKNTLKEDKSKITTGKAVVDTQSKSQPLQSLVTTSYNRAADVQDKGKKEIMNIKFLRDKAWIVWVVVGAFIALLRFSFFILFNKKLKATSRSVENQTVIQIFENCCSELGIHKKVALRVCKDIGTPMTTGLFYPVITIPKEDFDESILNMIFIHELMHYKSKDLWIKLLAFLASILHWFNPVIYMVNRELNKQCELSCDFQVIKNMNKEDRQRYGLAIINVANDSIERKMAFAAGMAVSSKNQIKERLFMIKTLKKSKKIVTFLSATLAVCIIVAAGLATNVLSAGKENKNTKDFAVVVKADGLWAVNLSSTSSEILLDKEGKVQSPVISPDGYNVAYTKDNSLYLLSIDLTKSVKEATKICDKVTGYTWADKENLAYTTVKGGLDGYNIKSKKAYNYLKNEHAYEGVLNLKNTGLPSQMQSGEHYDRIVGDGKGRIYGEKNRFYSKSDGVYVDGEGLTSYDIASGKEKLVVPSKPINNNDMGLVPGVAGISKDGAYVYIWCAYHAGSMSADGVPFGVYDVKNDKFTTFSDKEVYALHYRDNLAINPVDARFPVVNNGGNRLMNMNKTLGVADITSGKFTTILPENMVSLNLPYGETSKAYAGVVTMTPSFSPDGKKIIFSASKANADTKQWLKQEQNIYSVDLNTKKVEKITNSNACDFAPFYTSKGSAIAFLRTDLVNDSKSTLSLWRKQGDKEECVAKNIQESGSFYYYGHNESENCLDIYVYEE
ncbi:M56 family metallopeptidase [Clostridium thailandense]|uniref:M56 family metallopeptidase n=1 Tax=Clostridium thailandense TaxID=2794346 RepID=UPI003988D362